MEADGESLRSEGRHGKVCCMLASDASSGSGWIGLQKTQGTAERQKHHADVGAEFEMQYSKKVKSSAVKSVMPECFFGRFRG